MKTIKVKGMSCMHCVNSVVEALSALEGVGDVKVDLSSGEAQLEEIRPVDQEEIRKAVEQIGFEVEEE